MYIGSAPQLSGSHKTNSKSLAEGVAMFRLSEYSPPDLNTQKIPSNHLTFAANRRAYLTTMTADVI